MLISARNTLAQTPTTYLTNPEVAGTNILRWKNPAGFAASWAVQVGKTGANQSEVVLLSASTPGGTAGTLTANTNFEHPSDTPLYAIKYDQIVFERSTAGTTGTASPITNGTLTINAASLTTTFDDTSGTPTYGYRTYYRNSVTGSITTESSWLTSAGFSFYSLGKLRQRVKDKLYDATFIPVDQMIDDWLNEWLGHMNNIMSDVNEDYAIGTTSVSFAANSELGTITDTNFKGQIKRVWMVTGGGTFQATKMDSNSFIPTKTFVDSYPYFYMQGDSVLGRKPPDSPGTALIEYPITPSNLVNDTDEIPVPMHTHTSSFVDYALGQAKRKDNKDQEGIQLEAKAEAKAERFKTFITPRLRSGPTYMDIVEDTGADQDVWL